MKTIVMFQSFDGKNFTNEKDCLLHESQVKNRKQIDALLAKYWLDLLRDHEAEGSSGGYVALNREELVNIIANILDDIDVKRYS